MSNDYKKVTKDGVTPVIEIAHQRIGGIHIKLYTKDGYEKAKVLWDGKTLWIEEGDMSIHVARIPKVEFDEYS